MSEAAKNLDEAVRRGDTKAITIKGVWLAEGVVYPKNEEEALRLWKQAARQGSAEAAFNIGEFYYGSLGGDKWRSQGPSVRFALQEPIHWFLKAAKLGHKNATKRLHQEWSTETIDMIREQYPGDLQELDKLLHEPAK